MNSTQDDSKVQVTTDGRVTWVNSKQGCLARFAPISGEVYLDQGQQCLSVPQETYADWCRRVLTIHAIDVPLLVKRM